MIEFDYPAAQEQLIASLRMQERSIGEMRKKLGTRVQGKIVGSIQTAEGTEPLLQAYLFTGQTRENEVLARLIYSSNRNPAETFVLPDGFSAVLREDENARIFDQLFPGEISN